jgi:glycine/D-amino acid oxidase-like deaminating enzyme
VPGFAVLGCGVSGLSTARLVQRHFNGSVTIYAKDVPPNTTSNIAGAHWSPTTVFDSESVSAKFNDQFRQACRLSNRAFQLLVGAEYGVRWIETFQFYRNEPGAGDELPGGNELLPSGNENSTIRITRRASSFSYVKQFSNDV